jgi:hypothetical protein
MTEPVVQVLPAPYAEPGSDAARITALERQADSLAEQIAALRVRIAEIETDRTPRGPRR